MRHHHQQRFLDRLDNLLAAHHANVTIPDARYQPPIALVRLDDDPARLRENAAPELPPRTREALDRYATEHRPPGGFLAAVLENSSLTLPVLLADEDSLKALRLIVRHCYSELPPECWGSPRKGAAERA